MTRPAFTWALDGRNLCVVFVSRRSIRVLAAPAICMSEHFAFRGDLRGWCPNGTRKNGVGFHTIRFHSNWREKIRGGIVDPHFARSPLFLNYQPRFSLAISANRKKKKKNLQMIIFARRYRPEKGSMGVGIFLVFDGCLSGTYTSKRGHSSFLFTVAVAQILTYLFFFFLEK